MSGFAADAAGVGVGGVLDGYVCCLVLDDYIRYAFCDELTSGVVPDESCRFPNKSGRNMLIDDAICRNFCLKLSRF